MLGLVIMPFHNHPLAVSLPRRMSHLLVFATGDISAQPQRPHDGRLTDLSSVENLPKQEEGGNNLKHPIRKQECRYAPVSREKDGVSSDESHNEGAGKGIVTE